MIIFRLKQMDNQKNENVDINKMIIEFQSKGIVGIKMINELCKAILKTGPNSSLRKYVQKMNDQSDFLGDLYENRLYSKDMGQFFTPSIFKDLIIDIIKPQLKDDGTIETICDPTAGTGGFLTSSIKYIIKQSIERKVEIDWNFIKSKGISGYEIEEDTFELLQSNMLMLFGCSFDNVCQLDTIKNPIKDKFDIIVANPPYGLKGLKYKDIMYDTVNVLPIKSNNSISIFLQVIIDRLKIGGRCGIVLPKGKELFSSNNEYANLRLYLLKTCDLKEVIYLNTSSFTNTKVSTCIFYFIKKREGSSEVTFEDKKGKRQYFWHWKSYRYQTEDIKYFEYDSESKTKKLLKIVNVKDLDDKYTLI